MKASDFAKLTTSLQQAGEIRRGGLRPGHVTRFRPAGVRAIREQLEVTQEEFALLIGVSVATFRNLGAGVPGAGWPARALLRVAAANPQAVITALSA